MPKAPPHPARISGRAKNNERKTPRTDAWIEDLRRLLARRGARTELALHLADGNTGAQPHFQTLIYKVLEQKQRPSVEFALGADEWMGQQSDT